MKPSIRKHLSDAIQYYLLASKELDIKMNIEDAERLKIIAKQLQDGTSRSKQIQTNQSP